MKRFLFLIVLVYVLLVWFVSGLSRSAGWAVCLAGLAALACTILSLRRGQRRPFFIVCFVAANLALFAASGEAVLRMSPGLLRGQVANHAFGGYHCFPGGIYDRDGRMGHALKPSCTRDLYWNGHWWRHQTNAAGYRGALVERAAAVFLGDSMIYGHGVADEHTVPSQFHALTAAQVANLGQQGTCLVQMCARFRRTGTALQPRVLFVCCHGNDIAEASYWYPDDELRHFVADPQHYEPLARPEFQPRPWWRADHHLWDAHLAPSLRLTGALDAGLRLLMQPPLRQESQAVPQHAFLPPVEKLEEAFAPWEATASASERLGWQVHCQAAATLKHLCEQQNARLVLFDIGYPHAFSQAIEGLAARLQVDYSGAGRAALARALAGEDIYLANDGHWSPGGCRAVARELSACLEKSVK